MEIWRKFDIHGNFLQVKVNISAVYPEVEAFQIVVATELVNMLFKEPKTLAVWYLDAVSFFKSHWWQWFYIKYSTS